MKKDFVLVLALVLAMAPGAWAQVSGGNIYGIVSDESGAVLPGANIMISGATLGARTTTSGSQGDFRFLNLDPGTYRLSVNLAGFGTVNREVIVNTGTNVNITFPLKLATVEETVTITAETPVVDTKKIGTSTTLTKEELAQVPQGRDPWAVLKTVPGVIVDRVSIAGNEAGQQSVFVGKGAQPTDTMYNLDGVVITDTTSGGASPTYFDFDSFDEVAVSTGGNDLKVQTGGVGLNFVTKRGTNSFHGSARTFFSHDDLQSSNLPGELVGDPRLHGSDKADHIDQINDYGADLGGPIIKDKLWFWGSYGKNDIRLVRFTQTKDKTDLKNWNAKLNWQATSNDMVSFFFNNGAKQKFGRSPGQASTEPDSFLWNQGNFYPEEDCPIACGLHGLFKAEWNHTFSPSFYLNGKYAYYGWGYGFDPRGGTDKDGGVDKVLDEAFGSWVKTRFTKPWQMANLDGNYFFSGAGAQHELKFGFGYRHNPNRSEIAFSGSGLVGVRNNTNASDPTSSVAWVTRPYVAAFEANYTSAYLGDTMTKGRLTLSAGVRWDHQTAGASPSTAPANGSFPELLPELKFDGSTPGISWNDFSPRVSATLALDANRKTVARASYARYAGQLNPLDGTFNSPIAYGYTYLAYRWIDRNGDHLAQKDEILTSDGVLYTANVDPNHPTALSAVNQIDPNYKASHDHEAIVGIDHELAPNFAVGAAYTWRRGNDVYEWDPRLGLTAADYVANAPVTVNGYTARTFSPDPAKLDASNGGRLLTNRPDYHTSYSGIELTATKRLANKWMFRGAFSWMDWKEHYDGPGAIQNPTQTDLAQSNISAGQGSGPGIDGGVVAPKSYGAKTNTFFNAKWQASANMLYQLPAGFEVAGSLFGRQGYPKALYLSLDAGGDGALRTIPNALDSQRYDTLWNLDLRLAKNQKIAGNATLGLTLDLFNVFNSGTVLVRSRQVNSDAFGQITEIINPRILRFGVRLGF
jgi:Carboxypeptidase regulatory-like domain/TonB-dependent Receptor Plug Domain